MQPGPAALALLAGPAPAPCQLTRVRLARVKALQPLLVVIGVLWWARRWVGGWAGHAWARRRSARAAPAPTTCRPPTSGGLQARTLSFLNQMLFSTVMSSLRPCSFRRASSVSSRLARRCSSDGDLQGVAGGVRAGSVGWRGGVHSCVARDWPEKVAAGPG